MKRLLINASALALLLCLWSAPAEAAFGLHGLDILAEEEDGSTANLAGSHPFAFTTELAVDTVVDPVLELPVPEEDFRNLQIDLPPGFVGDRDATPQCTSAEFLPSPGVEAHCPRASAIGHVEVELGNPGKFYGSLVYNLVPPAGAVARLGFEVLQVPVTIDAGLSQEPPYHAVARLSNVAQVFGVYSSKLSLWGVPGASAHDAQRGGPVEGEGTGRPFLTLPSSCTGPLLSSVRATSWQGGFFEQLLESHGDGGEPLGMRDCAALGLTASIHAQPTAHSAEGPTGLDFGLDIADPGLTNPTGRADSEIKEARVTLPEGMTINPSQAEGLGVCSEKQLEGETLTSEPGEGCPQSSKIGTVEIESPLAAGEILKGALYVAKPYENLAGDSLIAFYIVIRNHDLGVIVKQPARVEPDPRTGQLITTTTEMPQLPFSHFRLHFREGGRSPLITPPLCGTYEAKAEFHTWANPAATYTTNSSFEVDSGVGGGPCPSGGAQPFDPGMEAGSLDANAGRYSPFYLRLTRRDGDQDLTRFSTVLPKGLVGRIAGVSRCSEAELAQLKVKTGLQEKAHPSCPANSELGNTWAGAGVGSQLVYVPGKLYLAGPINGAPLSVVAVTPAVAGPFDVGVVVVREALTLDPVTAQVQVDGSKSDPIPHILAGIPLKVRDVRVMVDRPNFTMNPTNCSKFQILATIGGGGADPFSILDDTSVDVSARFQAANCASLGFRPRLSLTLKGGTKRGDYEGLRAVVRPRPGDANIGAAQVALPHSAFLANEHIRTVCTRVQFAAGIGNGAGCPKGSIYGKAVAETPLLDEPLAGPVYLRSSNNPLPDLVVALHGIVDIELSGQTDSKNEGIRNTFASVPDAPASKFTLELFGGQKGLIVNSRNLCTGTQRATAHFVGQNGAVYDFRPALQNSCNKTKKAKKHKRR